METSAIPEIYYDLIARIVPGTIALGVYGWGEINKGFDLGKLSLGLIFSYMTGLMLNLLAEQFWHFILFRWRSKLWKSAKARKTDGELWLWIRSIPLIDRNLYTKMMAEKSLFASLTVGSLIMFCVPPPILPRHLVGFASVISFVIFSACMFRVNTWLSWHMREYRLSP